MDFKKKLKGAFDLFLLFGRGIKSFSGEKKQALRSLAIPVFLFVISLPWGYLYPPKGMEKLPFSQILMTQALQFVIAVPFSLLLVAGVAKALKKSDKFWLYLETSNWTDIPCFVVGLPFTVAAVMGWVPREEMDRLFVILQCYFYL